MQSLELYRLMIWVEEQISENRLIEVMDELRTILYNNVARSNNQAAQPFESQLEAVYTALSSIDTNALTLAQIQVLDDIGLKVNIGILGKAKLKKLVRNTLDIAKVAQDVDSMRDAVQQGLDKCDLLSDAFEPFLDDTDAEIDDDRVLTRVIFENDASVRNIDELKLWSSKWFDIGRGFAIANGLTPQDVQVIGGSRGSLVIELALLAATALPIAKAVNLIIDSMVKYKEFQLQAVEVRKMKEETPDMSGELEEDALRWEERAERLKDTIAKDVAQKVIEHFDNYNPESQNELNRAVKTLVDFYAKGGDVDCVIDDDIEEDEEENEEQNTTLTQMRILRKYFKRIRHAKETLKLEHRKAYEVEDE